LTPLPHRQQVGSATLPQGESDYTEEKGARLLLILSPSREFFLKKMKHLSTKKI
jgi:hypothetical protein